MRFISTLISSLIILIKVDIMVHHCRFIIIIIIIISIHFENVSFFQG